MRKQVLDNSLKFQSGFTLLEVMISLLLFLMVSASMATTFVAHLKHNTSAELRTGAVTAAVQKLDLLRFESPNGMPTSGTVGPESATLGKHSYDVYTTYCPVSTYCASANSRHIRVRVQYRGETLYNVDTVYTQLK